ncbi:hypothetical protein FRB95_010202 [Tulasnella sp. JGI-2019a]|nr:hypothetical protein FRB95_010202 [Tulasnella sp. JGI-2019a]
MENYVFSDTRLTVTFDIINTDPGWFHYAGGVHNSYGKTYACYMDNGRQVYDACFSNYYCISYDPMEPLDSRYMEPCICNGRLPSLP